MRIPRTQRRTADLLSERTARQLLKYQKNILYTEPKAFQFEAYEGTMEEKPDHYLTYIEKSKDNSLRLKAYLLLEEVIQPYLDQPRNLKTIWKILKKKEHTLEKII